METVWQFDAAGRISQFVSADGTATYGYDDTNQLTSETYVPASGATAPPNQTNAYDANGNRTNTGYVPDVNNETKSDGVYDYVYDNEGNRTRKTHKTTGEVTDYVWDYRNRLVSITTKSSDAGTVTKRSSIHAILSIAASPRRLTPTALVPPPLQTRSSFTMATAPHAMARVIASCCG